MPRRRHYKTGKFIKSNVYGGGVTRTHKEKQSYKAGFRAGYDKAVRDILG